MKPKFSLGGKFTFPGTSIAVHRLGYGAMQLTGPMAYGPPADPERAVAVVRQAVELGVDHIDSSDYYGPHVANRILREALEPYPRKLTLVTKVGTRRGRDKSWLPALSPRGLTEAVHDNLKNLGLEKLAIVNLRLGGGLGPEDGSVEKPLTALAELKARGLIGHIGLSNITPQQFEEARAIAEIVCVQNHYNLGHRDDDAFIDTLAGLGVAYVPFFPLGGFRPLKSAALNEAATALGVLTRQVAIAWLLQRAPNMLIISGTASAAHLKENLAAGDLRLPAEIVARLNEIGGKTRRK
jgi:pyridoxine 4-dehydrogenase